MRWEECTDKSLVMIGEKMVTGQLLLTSSIIPVDRKIMRFSNPIVELGVNSEFLGTAPIGDKPVSRCLRPIFDCFAASVVASAQRMD